MSYSRWSGSRWYTFWCVSHSNKKSEQIFSIDCTYNVKYAQLVWWKRWKILWKIWHDTKCSRWELFELNHYMSQFVQDVKHDKKIQ